MVRGGQSPGTARARARVRRDGRIWDAWADRGIVESGTTLTKEGCWDTVARDGSAEEGW